MSACGTDYIYGYSTCDAVSSIITSCESYLTDYYNTAVTDYYLNYYYSYSSCYCAQTAALSSAFAGCYEACSYYVNPYTDLFYYCTDYYSAGTTTPLGAKTSVPARFNGAALLTGTCATPQYTTLPGPESTIVYYAPYVGCIDNRPDCCPYSVGAAAAVVPPGGVTGIGPPRTVGPGVPSLTTVDQTSVETVSIGGSGASTLGPALFPSAAVQSQSVLKKCPADYHYIASVSGCCPTGYVPWTTGMGGQTPCFSTLSSSLTPPPILDNSPTDSTSPEAQSTTTSRILDVVYALQYQAQPPSSTLSTGAKAGIGGGVGAAVLIILTLIWLLIQKHRKSKMAAGAATAPAAAPATSNIAPTEFFTPKSEPVPPYYPAQTPPPFPPQGQYPQQPQQYQQQQQQVPIQNPNPQYQYQTPQYQYPTSAPHQYPPNAGYPQQPGSTNSYTPSASQYPSPPLPPTASPPPSELTGGGPYNTAELSPTNQTARPEQR